MSNYLILDLASTGIDNAADFISTDDIAAPSNYKDPVKIAAYCEEKRQERINEAALDIDLARITAFGLMEVPFPSEGFTGPDIRLIGDGTLYGNDTEHQGEAYMLERIAKLLRGPAYVEYDSRKGRPEMPEPTRLVSFNGLRYDWPLLMRRALYLGVDFPDINLDRYRTPHIDVWDILSHHGVTKAHSLTWYAKRFGWTDIAKPLSGAEEATAARDGRWDELKASVEHDVIACARLAARLKRIPAVTLAQPEPVL